MNSLFKNGSYDIKKNEKFQCTSATVITLDKSGTSFDQKTVHFKSIKYDIKYVVWFDFDIIYHEIVTGNIIKKKINTRSKGKRVRTFPYKHCLKSRYKSLILLLIDSIYFLHKNLIESQEKQPRLFTYIFYFNLCGKTFDTHILHGHNTFRYHK